MVGMLVMVVGVGGVVGSVGLVCVWLVVIQGQFVDVWVCGYIENYFDVIVFKVQLVQVIVVVCGELFVGGSGVGSLFNLFYVLLQLMFVDKQVVVVLLCICKQQLQSDLDQLNVKLLQDLEVVVEQGLIDCDYQVFKD